MFVLYLLDPLIVFPFPESLAGQKSGDVGFEIIEFFQFNFADYRAERMPAVGDTAPHFDVSSFFAALGAALNAYFSLVDPQNPSRCRKDVIFSYGFDISGGLDSVIAVNGIRSLDVQESESAVQLADDVDCSGIPVIFGNDPFFDFHRDYLVIFFKFDERVDGRFDGVGDGHRFSGQDGFDGLVDKGAFVGRFVLYRFSGRKIAQFRIKLIKSRLGLDGGDRGDPGIPDPVDLVSGLPFEVVQVGVIHEEQYSIDFEK